MDSALKRAVPSPPVLFDCCIEPMPGVLRSTNLDADWRCLVPVGMWP